MIGQRCHPPPLMSATAASIATSANSTAKLCDQSAVDVVLASDVPSQNRGRARRIKPARCQPRQHQQGQQRHNGRDGRLGHALVAGHVQAGYTGKGDERHAEQGRAQGEIVVAVAALLLDDVAIAGKRRVTVLIEPDRSVGDHCLGHQQRAARVRIRAVNAMQQNDRQHGEGQQGQPKAGAQGESGHGTNRS